MTIDFSMKVFSVVIIVIIIAYIEQITKNFTKTETPITENLAFVCLSFLFAFLKETQIKNTAPFLSWIIPYFLARSNRSFS